MNDKILLVGHGSRHAAGNQEINQFADQWRQRNPGWTIEVCFIEFADVLLDQGLDRAATGASRVVVVPLILNAAGHVKMELPEHIEQARRRHPDVEFIMTPHIGATEPVLNILKRRLLAAMKQLHMPDPKNTGVVVLGRGSSDRVANGEVAKMARWLQEEGAHDLVDIAFTGVTFPRLETVVQRQALLGMKQVVVLPYYLFTGTLIERIGHQYRRLCSQHPTISFALENYFGFEPEIFVVLEQRVRDALGAGDKTTNMMECDGCKYRQVAMEHGHGHHHHDHQHDHGHDHHHAH